MVEQSEGGEGGISRGKAFKVQGTKNKGEVRTCQHILEPQGGSLARVER